MLTMGTAVLCENTYHLVCRSRIVTVPSLRPIIAGQKRKNTQELCVITTFVVVFFVATSLLNCLPPRDHF